MRTDSPGRTPHLKRVVRAWPSTVIALLALVMLVWTYQTGRELGMDASISRASFPRTDYAIATAISRLVYGAPGYLLYTPVIESWKIGSRVTVDAEKGIY